MLSIFISVTSYITYLNISRLEKLFHYISINAPVAFIFWQIGEIVFKKFLFLIFICRFNEIKEIVGGLRLARDLKKIFGS